MSAPAVGATLLHRTRVRKPRREGRDGGLRAEAPAFFARYEEAAR